MHCHILARYPAAPGSGRVGGRERERERGRVNVIEEFLIC